MLELKVLESSGLTEVLVYGSYLYKLRAKWMLQSMAEWHRQRRERGKRPGDVLLAWGLVGVVLFLLLQSFSPLLFSPQKPPPQASPQALYSWAAAETTLMRSVVPRDRGVRLG